MCRNAVDHINNFDNDDPRPQNIEARKKCFAAWVIIIKLITKVTCHEVEYWLGTETITQQDKRCSPNWVYPFTGLDSTVL